MKKRYKTLKKQLNNNARLKRQIVFIFALLCILVGVIIWMCNLAFTFLRDSYYPTNVITSSLGAVNEIPENAHYNSLYNIAVGLEDTGYMIGSETTGYTAYAESGDYLAKLDVNTAETGYLYMFEGTGDVIADIEENTKYYYDFVGKIEPVYTASVMETGNLDGWSACYTAGSLEVNNFFKKDCFYVASIEYATGQGYLALIFVTGDIREVEETVNLMRGVGALALVWDTTDTSSHKANQDDSSGESVESEEMQDEPPMEILNEDKGGIELELKEEEHEQPVLSDTVPGEKADASDSDVDGVGENSDDTGTEGDGDD